MQGHCTPPGPRLHLHRIHTGAGGRKAGGGVDTGTYDLSVKNPNARETTEYRSPLEILDEIAALDAESARVLESIRALL